MARKHSGRPHRAKTHRPLKLELACRGCGKVQVVSVRPPPGVELYCVACTTEQRKVAARDTAK